MFRFLVKSSLVLNTTKLPLKIGICGLHTKLDTFVNPKYSYAFGKGTIALTNHNLNHYLNNLEKNPDKELFISYSEDKKLNSNQFVEDVKKLATGLHNKLNLRKGDVICLWSLNCYDWIKIFFACQSIGVTICTVNPYYFPQELGYALTKCNAKALFLPGSESSQNNVNKFLKVFNSDIVQNQLKETGNLKNLIFIDENKDEYPSIYQSFNLNELNENKILHEDVFEKVEDDDPCIIMYTSGTTGKPKGVVLNNFSVLNNSNISSSYFMKDLDNTVIVLPLPLFHSFALVCGAVSMAVKGIKTILTGYRFNSKDVVDAILKYNATFIMVTPTMIIDIVNYISKNNIQISSLKTIVLGGAPFPSEISNSIKKALPSVVDIRIGYGLTETSPVATVCTQDDPEDKRLNTVGKPIDYIELKVVDPQTNEIVKLGEKGELLIRGHNIMVNYFNDEEKTKEVISSARWFKTGDQATMDEEGYVKICGRTKELIIKGGENIYPKEIEDVMHQHPNVLDAYAFSIPDQRLGEIVGCWIKLIDPKANTTAEEMQEFCKSRLTGYKVPTHIMFVDQFPYTSTGKVKKFEMTKITCEKLGIKH